MRFLLTGVCLLSLAIVSCGENSPTVNLKGFQVKSEPVELTSQFVKCEDSFSGDLAAKREACDGRASAQQDENLKRECAEEYQRLQRVFQNYLSDQKGIIDRFRKNCLLSGMAVMSEQSAYEYCNQESVLSLKSQLSPGCGYDVLIDKSDLFRWRVK